MFNSSLLHKYSRIGVIGLSCSMVFHNYSFGAGQKQCSFTRRRLFVAESLHITLASMENN